MAAEVATIIAMGRIYVYNLDDDHALAALAKPIDTTATARVLCAILLEAGHLFS